VLVDNVHFVDIGGIDGHHCLNFLFIMFFLGNLAWSRNVIAMT